MSFSHSPVIVDDVVFSDTAQQVDGESKLVGLVHIPFSHFIQVPSY